MAITTISRNKKLIVNSLKTEKPVDVEKIKAECPYFESANKVHKIGKYK